MVDAARKIFAGEDYQSARSHLLAAGWELDREASDSRCAEIELESVCRAYPETGKCWEDGGRFCSMMFASPQGDTLMVRVLIDHSGKASVFDSQFFSEDGDE